MKPTRYPHKLKLGITKAQAAWLKRRAKTQSEAAVVRSALDRARKAGKVRA